MVNQGYKQTEIGIIPANWEICVAKDLYLKARIGWQGLKKDEYLDEGDYYLVTGTDFSDNKISWENCHYVLQERYDQDKNIQLSIGDILITKDGSIGKTAFVDTLDKPATLNSGIFLVRPKNDKIDQAYLYFVFKSEYFNKFLKDLTAGSTIVHLYQKDFVAFKYPLPERKEQERIAEALSDVDGMISSLEKLIAKKKAVKQGAMQELLTGKKRLLGFTGEWEGCPIGKMGEFYSGLSGKSKKDFDCGEAYYITFLNVLSNVKIDTSILASVDVRENESQNAVRKGDLFFNTSSETPEEVGMCAVLDEELENTYLNSFCFGFRLNDDTHNPLFLSYYLNSAIGRKIMSVLAQGATRYNLSKNNFAETVIQLPEQEEQNAIASILSDMDNEIESLEQKLEKTRQIKQGMMQQLLTGKIRLV